MDFQGGPDADSVSGGTGADVLRGGGGDDWISDYSDGDDQLFGEDGDDQLWIDRTSAGLATNALLDGGIGNDRLGFRGFSVDDGGDRSHSSSRVTMNGGEGADYFYLSDANVAVIDGGPGDDHVAIDLFGDYTVTLGAGRDLLELADPRNFFFTGRPVVVTDFVTGAGGDRLDLIDYVADLLFAWDPATNPFGTYLQIAQQGADVVLQIDRAGAFDADGFLTVLTFQNVAMDAFTAENLGGWASDGSAVAGVTFPVTTGDDFIIGLSGNDVVVGSDGADRIRGGAGNDRLEGGEGLDIIVGEFGDDEIIGGGGNDQLLDKHSGNDTLRGGAGNDLVYVQRESGAVSRVLLDGGDGDDYVSYIAMVGSSAETILLGGGGNDNIVLNGDQGATIDAGPGDDGVLIYLSNGSFDMLLGPGADTIEIGFDSQRDGIASFTVRDFQAGAGGDLFRLDPTFDGYWSNWDGVTSLFKTGHLQLVQQGADTLLQIDRDGGGDAFMDFVTFRSATVGGVSQNMRGSNLAPLLAPPTNGDDTIEGTPGDDVIDGLNGADTIYGRAGNDRLSGGDGNDRLFGEEDNDSLSGGAGDDFLVGGIGHDSLDGGAGADRAEGGAGDDTYFVDSAADVAFELPSEGTDLLVTRVSYVLGANIELMQAAAIGGVESLSLTGNALGNTIWATFGSNSIDGGAGADVMYGYGGNDVYFVDNAGDAAVEFEGHGTDLVATSVNYVLGANIENMQARSIPGTDPLSLTGNALGNIIWGNFGDNSLDGGTGADVMYGYGGNDTFIVDNAGDAAVEFEGHGTDLIVTSVNYVLGANVENMQSRFIPGTDTLSLTGNALANTIWGNFGDNSLDGGAGADTMYGYGGNDVYYVDNAGDRLLEWEGHGTDLVATSVSYVLDPNVENLQAAYIPGTIALSLTGNGLGNVIWGNFGHNSLDGGAGADVMYGYGGDDTFIVDNAGDAAVEFEGHGTDLVVTSVSYVLGANLENMQSRFIPGIDTLSLTGNALANTIWGNFGDNSLDGGAGADTMYGYGGNDTYYVDNADDRLLEWDGHGIDLVATSVSYVLDPNVENLQARYIPGTEALSLTGNGLANVIWGNFGNNVIDGGAGADVMYGYGGNDTFTVDNAGDAAVEFEGHGTDLVITSISHVLGANLESLQAANIAGTAPLSLTGNGLANVIWGNFGSNLIDGGAGADVMYGYGGDDTYVVDAAGDQVSELAGGGYDTVLTTVSYVLGPDQEALKVQNPLQDFGFITLTGNELGNVISGHDWVNYIDGKGGNDVLAGGDTRDEFHFTTALDASNNVDTIVDFNPASDLIVLAGGATDPFSAFASGWASWEIGTAAAGPGATLVYDPGTGSLSYDADGAGGLAAVLFAKLTPGTALGSNSISVSGPNTTQTITSATTLSVPENVPISTPIYRITASDPDGDALTYMLDGPNKWAFTVDPRTGDVRFVSSPDFEAMSKYEVQVIAKASSGEIASKFLTVTITDLVEAVDPYHLTDTEPNDSIFGAQTLDRAKFASTSETNVPDRPLPAATITGSISSGTDKDFYSIQLQAGEMLILDVDGTVTLDSELKVYGGGGVVIASNDDPGSFDPGSTAHAGLSHNMDSLIRVRAPTTGTYTFSIASFVEENGSTSQGAYTLHVVVAPPATEAQIEEENIQALLAGSAWDTLTLTYGFTTSGSQYGAGEGTAEIAAGMQSLNAAQQAAVRTILGQYSNVTNLSFNELTASPGAAHMRYALSSDPDTAHAYHPGPGDGGDSWYNISSYNNPVVGNYQWLTFIHETGHATGLKHGHESPALSPNRDSMEYSVMTYRSYTGSSVEDDSGFSNETWGYAQTLMMYDIAALQRLYGADFGYNAGDSVYSWDQNNGSFLINGVTQWIPGGNRILMTLWDGGGNDTYDLSNYVTAAMIDLRPGHFSKFSDVQIANLGDGHKAVGNVANALLYNNDPRSLIENVIGSSGNDAITGNNAVNRLTGGGGSDTFSFWTVSQSPTGAADTILDFLHGTDKIGLNGIDSISGTPGNDPFTYIGTAAFSGAAGELRVTASGGVSQIFADVNGDAIADLHIFVHAVIDQTDLFL